MKLSEAFSTAHMQAVSESRPVEVMSNDKGTVYFTKFAGEPKRLAEHVHIATVTPKGKTHYAGERDPRQLSLLDWIDRH